MTAVIPLLTADDLDDFPDDGKRRELIGGVLTVGAAPVREHNELLLASYRFFFGAAETTGWGRVYLAPTDVRFSDRDQVQPDLLVIRRDRLHIYRGHVVHGPPDLILEIASPSTRHYDEVEKAALYAAHGVPEYWLAAPGGLDFRLLALRHGAWVPVEPDADGRLHSTVVPGLVLDPVALLAAAAGDLP